MKSHKIFAKEVHYVRKVQRLEAYIYHGLQQDSKIYIKDEARLNRNVIKKANAKAEAVRETKNFDEKLNMYLRHRFKLVNNAVSLCMHTSYKYFSSGCKRYEIIEADRDILSQIDYTAVYKEGHFNDLLRTTDLGNDMSIVDSKTYCELNSASNTLNSLNSALMFRKTNISTRELSVVNKLYNKSYEKSMAGFEYGISAIEPPNKISTGLLEVKNQVVSDISEDLLGLSINTEDKNVDKKDSLVESINTLNLVCRPADKLTLREETYLTRTSNVKNNRYKSTGNLFSGTSVPKIP